jgi:hypothetical protein
VLWLRGSGFLLFAKDRMFIMERVSLLEGVHSNVESKES